jgi:DNA-directed RNA polymerase specialized sigma24 family protein
LLIRASGGARASRRLTHRNEALSDNDFARLSEAELQRLSSDDLISYIRKATGANQPDSARTGVAILCFRHYDDVVRRVKLRVPAEDVEDVAMTAMLAAIKSAFDGVSVGQFVNWLHRIVDRRGIADYHRRREGDPGTQALPSEHLGDEEIWGDEPPVADESGAVAARSVIDECLAALGNTHREVIEHYVFVDLDADETTARVNADHADLDPPMSNENVHQIASRFRKCVRGKLSDEDAS